MAGPAAVVLIGGGDVADALDAGGPRCSGRAGARARSHHGRIVDGVQVWVLGLEVAEEGLDPRLVVRVPGVPVLSDAGRHRTSRSLRRSSGPLSERCEQHRTAGGGVPAGEDVLVVGRAHARRAVRRTWRRRAARPAVDVEGVDERGLDLDRVSSGDRLIARAYFPETTSTTAIAHQPDNPRKCVKSYTQTTRGPAQPVRERGPFAWAGRSSEGEHHRLR